MYQVIMKKARISEILVSDDYRRVTVKSLDNGKEILNVSANTKIYEDQNFLEKEIEDLEVGDPIYIYTKENTPMMLSNPPQYTPYMIIVAHNEDELFQVTDYFDENLMNSTKTIQINYSSINMIESLSHEGLIKELLMNKELVVFYHLSTRSIPALINPVKIIIL